MATLISNELKNNLVTSLGNELDKIRLYDTVGNVVGAGKNANHSVTAGVLQSNEAFSEIFEIPEGTTIVGVHLYSQASPETLTVRIPFEAPVLFSALGYYTVTSYQLSIADPA